MSCMHAAGSRQLMMMQLEAGISTPAPTTSIWASLQTKDSKLGILSMSLLVRA